CSTLEYARSANHRLQPPQQPRQATQRPGPAALPKAHCQNPQMLWIVTEFHHVEISVGAAHQMSLRPAPHPPHVLDSDYSHIRWLRSRSAAQSAPSYPESLFLDVTDEHRQNSPPPGQARKIEGASG